MCLTSLVRSESINLRRNIIWLWIYWFLISVCHAKKNNVIKFPEDKERASNGEGKTKYNDLIC